jgi:hypothetical protein
MFGPLSLNWIGRANLLQLKDITARRLRIPGHSSRSYLPPIEKINHEILKIFLTCGLFRR